MSAAVSHGGLVFTAGQTDTTTATVTDQARVILEKIEGLLARAGSRKELIVSANIWLSDISSFEEFNAVWDAWVPAPAPARATVEARLASPKYLIEIAVVAATEA